MAAVDTGHYDIDESLAELAELARTAGIEVIAQVTQSRGSPDKSSYFGKGKLEELKECIDANEITLVVFDDELSPAQLRTIEKILNPDEHAADVKVHVMDRTMLILDIFAMRAHSREAKRAKRAYRRCSERTSSPARCAWSTARGRCRSQAGSDCPPLRARSPTSSTGS